MQKFIFHKNTTRIHREAHLGVGSCTLLSPPYTLYPQTGVFLKVWCPPSPSKKTAPGNSRFKPRNSIWQGNACKILLGWEKPLGFD